MNAATVIGRQQNAIVEPTRGDTLPIVSAYFIRDLSVEAQIPFDRRGGIGGVSLPFSILWNRQENLNDFRRRDVAESSVEINRIHVSDFCLKQRPVLHASRQADEIQEIVLKGFGIHGQP
jgi:hypothetical protein